MTIRKRLDVYKVLRKYNSRYHESSDQRMPSSSLPIHNRFSIKKMREKQRELADKILRFRRKAE